MLPHPIIHYPMKLTDPSKYVFVVSYITDRSDELLYFKAEWQEIQCILCKSCCKAHCFITASVIKFIIKHEYHNTEMPIKFKVYSAIYCTNKSLNVPVNFLK